MTEKGAFVGSFHEHLASQDVARRSRRKKLSQAAAGTAPLRNDLLPKLTLVDCDPKTLVAPERNVRSVNAAHVREVANSISALGFTVPVLIDARRTIIDGLVRLKAAEALGLPSIPCVIADAHTASERKLLRIASNHLAEKGTWCLDELKLELEELIVEDLPIEISGFEPAELDGILTEGEQEVVEPGPLAPLPYQRPVACSGDVFLLGKHRVICGDARDPAVLARLLGEDKARFVLTDQPYNVAIAGHVTGGDHREFVMASGEMTAEQFLTFNEAWIGASAHHLVEGGLLATFIDWRGLSSVTAAAAANQLPQMNLIVWSKTNAGMGSLYRSQHELLPLFKKGDAPHLNNVELGRKGRWRSNVWIYAGASSAGSDARNGLQYHPTVKPVAMLADALRDVTNLGEIVLDPFLGSGSTLIAAQLSGRICRGVEIDPLYVDLIIRRYEEVTGETAVLEETKETFAALAHRRSEPQRAEAPPIKAPQNDGNQGTCKTEPFYRVRTRSMLK